MATYFGFEPYIGDDKYVFISYKSEESEKAAVFAQYLHENGVNVYYDAALSVGDKWAKQLLDAVKKENCVGVIFLASKLAIGSQPIIDEITRAHYSQKPILAVYLEDLPNLEEPLKTYLSYTQSIFAWKYDEIQACEKLLQGAQNLLEGEKAPAERETKMEEHWKTARFFLSNAGRGAAHLAATGERLPNFEKDIDKAKAEFQQMTELAPTDYRGWFGLALCECMLGACSLDEAKQRFSAAAANYSYVMAAQADKLAGAEYTAAKSQMWRGVLRLIERSLDQANGSNSALCSLLEEVSALENCFGHTEPFVRSEYDALIEKIKTCISELPLEQVFEWKQISSSAVELVKYNGDEKAVIIPSEFDGKQVVSIGEKAFANTAITSVIVLECVKSIGDKAFADCASLLEVCLPDRIKFGAAVFENCKNLTLYSAGKLFSSVKSYAAKNHIKYEPNK